MQRDAAIAQHFCMIGPQPQRPVVARQRRGLLAQTRLNDREKMQRGEVTAVGVDDALAQLLGLAELAGAKGGKSAAKRLWQGERGVVHAQNTGAGRNDIGEPPSSAASDRGSKL